VPASVEAFEGNAAHADFAYLQGASGYVDFDGVRRIERAYFAGTAASAIRE